MVEPTAVLSFSLEAAGLLAESGSGVLRKRTRRTRVARVAAGASGIDGIQVTPRVIRRWLGREDSLRLIEARTEVALSQAARSLSVVISGGTAEGREANASVVLAHVLKAYVHDLNPSEAARLTAAWGEATVRHEGEVTRAALAATEARLRSRLDAKGSFEANLGHLPPLIAEPARGLQSRWPDMDRLISEVAASKNRRTLLREWGEVVPSWMSQAPPCAHAILGTLAASYGENMAAIEHFTRAVQEGCAPRAYYLARAGQCAEAAGDHQRALGLLEEATRAGDDYANAIVAAIEGRLDDADSHLSVWEVRQPEQRYEKGVLQARLERARGNLSVAVSKYEQVAEDCGAFGVLLEAAEVLLQRGVLRRTADRLADARRALELALRSRDSRRAWGGDSVSPAALAVIASVLSGDLEGAWRLTQPAPTGDANAEEAADARIREHAAITAALTGRVAEARALFPSMVDDFPRLCVVATLLERGEIIDPRYTSTTHAWSAAIGFARNASEKLQAARALAEEGVAAPGLDDLAVDYPELVEEIRSIATALASGEDRVVRMRASAHQSPVIALRLAEHYRLESQPELAAEALRDAGERWSDPHLMIMAANEYRAAGRPAEAVGAAQRAIASGASQWPGIRDAYILLVEVHSDMGKWNEAADAARALVALDQEDANARWALTRCLHMQRDFPQAWYALTANGRAIEPRSSAEALVWVDLRARCTPPGDLLKTLLEELPKWTGDERVFAAFVQTFLTPPGVAAVPSVDEVEGVRRAIAEFTERFPDSAYFRAVHVDLENPLESIRAEAFDEHRERALAEIHEAVKSGRLPLGVLASTAGRTLTEASLRRAAGVVYAQKSMDMSEDLSDALRGAHAVVIDPTVAHTLRLLSQPTASYLLGAVPNVTTTDSLFDDALHARDSLAHKSTMSLGWDSETGSPVVSTIAESDADWLAEMSAGVVQSLTGIRRLPRTTLKNLGELNSFPNGEWISGVDLALELGCPYWTDDRALGDVARQFGLTSFGTLSLLQWANKQPGGPSNEIIQAETATLLSNFYVEVPFSRDVWTLAAQHDGWQPRGIASSLRRPEAWRDLKAVMRFVLQALREVQASDPAALRGWVAAAAVGLARIAGGVEEARKNLALWGETVLAQDWFGPDHAYHAVQGLRDASSYLGVPDPLLNALTRYHKRLVDAVGYEVAASFTRALFAQTDEGDQRIAARVVLTAGLAESDGASAAS